MGLWSVLRLLDLGPARHRKLGASADRQTKDELAKTEFANSAFANSTFDYKEGFADDVQTKTELANSTFDYGNSAFGRPGWCTLAHNST
jgi:hypothetical protein